MGMGMDDRLKLPKLLDWHDLWFLDIMAFGWFILMIMTGGALYIGIQMNIHLDTV